MVRSARAVLIALTLVSSAGTAAAAPAEEANAVVDQWSAAFTANDPEAVVQKNCQTRSCSGPSAR